MDPPPPECNLYTSLTCPLKRCRVGGNGCENQLMPLKLCNDTNYDEVTCLEQDGRCDLLV